MQIIGHTSKGYLVEIFPHEIAAITGVERDASHVSLHGGSYNHAIGTKFEVTPTWNHLKSLLANEDRRKRIAESLRAAATLIENTPSPIVELVTNETPAE